jgi:hypothetical protein
MHVVKDSGGGHDPVIRDMMRDSHAFQIELFHLKCSTLNGHMLVGWAMLINLLGFVVLAEGFLSAVGIAWAVSAYACAWLMNAVPGNEGMRWAAVAGTAASWVTALIWAVL